MATPTPSPTPDDGGGSSGSWPLVKWAILLLVVLLVFFAAYRIVKLIVPPRPTLIPRADQTPEFNDDVEPLAVEFQLLLDSNMPSGEYEFQPDGPELIAYVRRENE